MMYGVNPKEIHIMQIIYRLFCRLRLFTNYYYVILILCRRLPDEWMTVLTYDFLLLLASSPSWSFLLLTWGFSTVLRTHHRRYLLQPEVFWKKEKDIYIYIYIVMLRMNSLMLVVNYPILLKPNTPVSIVTNNVNTEHTTPRQSKNEMRKDYILRKFH